MRRGKRTAVVMFGNFLVWKLKLQHAVLMAALLKRDDYIEYKAALLAYKSVFSPFYNWLKRALAITPLPSNTPRISSGWRLSGKRCVSAHINDVVHFKSSLNLGIVRRDKTNCSILGRATEKNSVASLKWHKRSYSLSLWFIITCGLFFTNVFRVSESRWQNA